MTKTWWRVAIGCTLLVASSFAKSPIGKDAPSQSQILVRMERFPGCRLCPGYELLISPQGAVRYLGKRSVQTLGERNGQISLAQVNSLTQDLERLGSMSLLATYPNKYVPDAALFEISFNTGGKLKSIQFTPAAEGAPKELSELVSRIDAVTNVFQWICPLDRNLSDTVCKRRKF